jgi:Cu/Ag efflux protein CusF
MQKNLHFVVMVAALLAVLVGPWRAQALPSRWGMQVSAPVPAETSVEGTVKKVNPAAKTIEVSTGVSGLWEKKLELTDRTQIRDEGRAATLDDIQEGVKVKASYETRVGKSFATRIELMPTPPPKETPRELGPRVK